MNFKVSANMKLVTKNGWKGRKKGPFQATLAKISRSYTQIIYRYINIILWVCKKHIKTVNKACPFNNLDSPLSSLCLPGKEVSTVAKHLRAGGVEPLGGFKYIPGIQRSHVYHMFSCIYWVECHSRCICLYGWTRFNLYTNVSVELTSLVNIQTLL